MALYIRGILIYDRYDYGPNSYGLYRYGLNSYGLSPMHHVETIWRQRSQSQRGGTLQLWPI